MSSHGRLRKEKVSIMDYDTQIKDVRSQLVDQLKVLDLQLEQKSQQLQDLTDYLRRRGEIEGDYARGLEKLAEKCTSKIKSRKEPSSQSVAQVWLSLLTQTRQESRDHSLLSDSCSDLLTQPLLHCLEYTQRLARRSKDICTQLQDGLLKDTTELQTAWRTYYQYHSQYVCAEGKLKEADSKLEEKQKQSSTKKVERLIEKRQCKLQEIHLKCSKARNDYLLHLAAANASLSKYYLKDISTLIDCADTGYHISLGNVMLAYLSRRSHSQQNLNTGLLQLQETVAGLSQSQDRDALLQAHYDTFCLPFRFPYQPHEGDQVSEVSAEQEMRDELETRFKQLQARLASVNNETEKADRCRLAAYSSLLQSINEDNLELSSGSPLEGSTENLAVKPSVARRKANQLQEEENYFSNVKDYLVNSSLVSKLQAKHDLLKVAVEKAATNGRETRCNTKSTRVRRNQSFAKLIHNHKLFNGDMLSYIQASGQPIPIVVESCIRYINLNGLHHEGIFRVPGSQVEVNNLRDAFERGDDPLADTKCDLDSVAGVLKLYFRGLENPLFPNDSTSQLLEYTQMENETERADKLKTVIASYPAPVIVVMRYLFAFLHHVSQYSDENMMQPYNLAVCFGPSLVRMTHTEDVVTLQPQINILVKDIILQHESIFPGKAEVQGPVYEKCMTLEQDDSEPITEEGDVEAEYYQCKDDLGTGSFTGRSSSLLGAQTQNKEARPRADSKGSSDRRSSRFGSTGGSVSAYGKLFQLPIVAPNKPPHSPHFLSREPQRIPSSEDIAIHVDKVVCRQMDSVFKELLCRQGQQDPSRAACSPTAQPLQRKGRREENKGRASGPFKTRDQLD